MKKFIIALFFCLTMYLGNTCEAADQKTQPDGFGGIKWLEPLAKYQHEMSGTISTIEDGTYRSDSYLKLKEGNKKFGNIKIDGISYSFDRAGFAGVKILSFSTKDIAKFSNACIEKWGPPDSLRGNNTVDENGYKLINHWEWEQVIAQLWLMGDIDPPHITLVIHLKDWRYRDLLYSSNPNQPNYVLVGSVGKDYVYLDINSVEFRGNYVVAWSKRVPTKGSEWYKDLKKEFGQEVNFIQTLCAYNIDKNQYLILAQIVWGINGQSLRSGSFPFSEQDYKDILPNNMFALTYPEVMRIFKMLK